MEETEGKGEGGRPLRHVSRDLLHRVTKRCLAEPGCGSHRRKEEKHPFSNFLKRFNELNRQHIIVGSYPIKSTTTADRIRRALPRLKVLKTVVKTIRSNNLFALSERRRGEMHNWACIQEEQISCSAY